MVKWASSSCPLNFQVSEHLENEFVVTIFNPIQIIDEKSSIVGLLLLVLVGLSVKYYVR